MDTVETLEINGYTVEISYDRDALNPFAEFDGSPTLVLHERAEQKFGWTNDEEWGRTLNAALDHIAEHGVIKRLYGRGGALDCIRRWLKIYHGTPVVLSVGAGDHSGYWTYLGEGADFGDPGGWDSGWVGWLFASAKDLEEWGCNTDPTYVERTLRDSFTEFQAWVSGNCYGYTVTAPDGEDVSSCWGYYGSQCYDERTERKATAAWLLPGTVVQCPDGSTDTIESVTDAIGTITEPHWGDRSPTVLSGEITVNWQGRSPSTFTPEDPVTIIEPGYMRQCFLDEIEAHRNSHIPA